ncbi:MAG: hypothetical protein R2762_04085 [Bryobacteraceae bacterium]
MQIEVEPSPVFREQARAWLTLVAPSADIRNPRVFSESGSASGEPARRVVVAETVNCPDGFTLRETLLVRGDFHTGANCRFLGPVYVGGRATLGRASEVYSICVDGAFTAGLDTRIHRWADALGRVDLRAGAWAREAVSSTSIDVSQQASASGLFAPRIATHGVVAEASAGRGGGGDDAWPAGSDYVEIPLPASGREPELGAVRGFRRERLSALGAETWVYDGSLNLPFPVLSRAKLVVRGSFTCPAGSLLEDDVKAGSSIRLGEGAISNGNLTARGEVTLDAHCLFSGHIRAGLSLRLRSGVRGYSAAGPVEAWAREQIHLEPNVIVRGRVTSESGRIRASQPLLEGGLDLLLAEL